MIIYHSGTPGIRGGLPEQLRPELRWSVMVSYLEVHKTRAAKDRLKQLLRRRKKTCRKPR